MSIRAEQPTHLKAIAEARTNPVAVANRLKDLRNKRELSQAGLAKLAGVSQQTVGHIETARVDSPRHLDVLSDALGVHPHYLRTGRMPGVPFFAAEEFLERSDYPSINSEYGLDHAMLEPHIKLGPLAFAVIVPDDACAPSGAPKDSIVVVTPEYTESDGDLILVHYKRGPTLRHFRDSRGEPEYVPSNPMHATLDSTVAEYIGKVVEVRRILIPYSK